MDKGDKEQRPQGAAAGLTRTPVTVDVTVVDGLVRSLRSVVDLYIGTNGASAEDVRCAVLVTLINAVLSKVPKSTDRVQVLVIVNGALAKGLEVPPLVERLAGDDTAGSN